MPGGLVPVQVEYYDNAGEAVVQLDWTKLTAVPTPPVPANNSWRGEYFNNISLAGQPVMVRNDAQVNFNWQTNSPAPDVMDADRFSVRWTRTLDLSPGRYQLTTRTDDGVRLWVNGQLLIDQWQVQSVTSHSDVVEHPGGPLSVVMAYFENSGRAEAQLSWTQVPPEQPVDPAIPTATMTGAAYLNVRSGPGLEFEPFSHLRRRHRLSSTTINENPRRTRRFTKIFFSAPLRLCVKFIFRGETKLCLWLAAIKRPFGLKLSYQIDNRTGWVSSRYMISDTAFVNLPVVSP